MKTTFFVGSVCSEITGLVAEKSLQVQCGAVKWRVPPEGLEIEREEMAEQAKKSPAGIPGGAFIAKSA